MGKGNTTAKSSDSLLEDILDPSRNDLKDFIEGRTTCDEKLRLFSLKQVAVAYDVHEETLKLYARQGLLRVARIGQRYGCTVAALREFLKEREETSITTSRKQGHPGIAMTKKLTKRKRPTTKAKTARATTPRPSKQSGGNS